MPDIFPDITIHGALDPKLPEKGPQYRTNAEADKVASSDSKALIAALSNLDDKLHHKGSDSLETKLSAGIAAADKMVGPATHNAITGYSYANFISAGFQGKKAVFTIKIDDQHQYEIPVTHENITKLVQAVKDAADDRANGVYKFAHVPNGTSVSDQDIISGLDKVFDKDLAAFKKTTKANPFHL